MFLQSLIFEWKYYSRHLTFLIAAVIFFLLGLDTVQRTIGGASVHVNSPYAMTFFTNLISLNLLFVITVFCVRGILRDRAHQMEEIIYSTSISKSHYLLGRFSGLVFISFLILCISVFGMMCGHLFMSSPDRIGPMMFQNYIWPLVIIGLPNIIFCAAMLLAVSALTRNAKATYVTGVLIYILYMVGSIVGNSPLMAISNPTASDHAFLSILLDPFGFIGFLEQTRYWSPIERNTQLVTLEGNFLINRLIWTSVSLLVFGYAYKRFSFRVGSKPDKKHIGVEDRKIEPIKFQKVEPSLRKWTFQWVALFSKTRLETLEIIKNIPFVVLVLAWTFYVGIEITDGALRGIFNITYYPTTGIIFETLQRDLLGVLILIFFSGELIWREQDVNIAELVDATPATNFILYGSKCLSLLAVIIILISINIILGITIQIVNGFYDIDLGIYISLFYYKGLPFFLFAVFSLFIQTLVPNKYVGMMVTGLIFVVFIFGDSFGINHPMLHYGMSPELLYSDMNGFGQTASAFHLYMLYWGGLTGLLLLISFGLLRRGQSTPIIKRFQKLPSLWGKPAKTIAFISLLIFAMTGGYIFYQTNLLNEYQTRNETLDLLAGYEKKYKQYAQISQPTVISVKTNVDLFPEEMRYHVEGRYRLKNKTNKPIDRILVNIHPEVSSSSVSVSNGKLLEYDKHFYSRWFQFDRLLQPGEETDMNFTIDVQKSGFSIFNGENSIVSNGSYIELEKFIPQFGYMKNFELSNAAERRKRGLSEQETFTPFVPEKTYEYEFVWYESIVSTSADQIAITVGELQKEWQKNGRRYFHYKTNQPINFSFAHTSGQYKTRKEKENGIDFEFYYEPDHGYNVDRMMEATKKSLAYYKENYGPYRHNHVKFIEIPRSRPGAGATAYPGLNLWTQMGFLMDLRDPGAIDQVTYSTAHEIAHQWWAHHLGPAEIPGYGLLTEGLATFSSTMYMEKTFGKRMVRRAFEKDLDLYFSFRGWSKSAEELLYQVDEQSQVAYRKGNLVLYALKELIGEDAVNLALSNLVKKYAYPNPQATSLDLIEELYHVAPQEHHRLIDDWFKKRVLYDLKIAEAFTRQLNDGRYEVTITVITKKKENDGNGNETPMAMNESFDIGIFTEHPEDAQNDQVLYLKRHQFNEEKTELSLTVDKKPTMVGIDPYIYMLDQNWFENLKTVENITGE